MKYKEMMGSPKPQKDVSASDYPRSLKDIEEINRRIRERDASKSSRHDPSPDARSLDSALNNAFGLFGDPFNMDAGMQSSSAKQDSSAEQPKISDSANQIDPEELERINKEHAERMSFLCDLPNEALSPETQRLKNLVEILLFRGRELCAAFEINYQRKGFDGDSLNGDALYEKLKNIQVRSEYQLWYTEALAVIKLVLPSRVDDFIGLYEYPAKRSKLTKVNFRIADAMRGHSATEKIKTFVGDKNIVAADWSTCHYLVLTQCDILEAAAASLTTSLHKFQLSAQRNLFNTELLAACDLCAKGFNRASGVMAGAILERYFANFAKSRPLVLHKKNPSLYDYAQKLMEEDIIDAHDGSLIQRLGDLYNRCLKEKDAEPEKKEIEELLLGVGKIFRTL